MTETRRGHFTEETPRPRGGGWGKYTVVRFASGDSASVAPESVNERSSEVVGSTKGRGRLKCIETLQVQARGAQTRGEARVWSSDG